MKISLIKIITIIFMVSSSKSETRVKRWFWDDILNLASSSSEAKDVVCGLNPIDVNITYRIKTPLYSIFPAYPSGFQCTWKFYGIGCNPVINCNEFSLAESSGCSGAHLEITDGVSASQKFCGSKGPINATTGSSILEAVFPRSFSVPTKGFSCLITCSAASTNDGLYVIPTSIPPPTQANCSCGVPGGAPNNASSTDVSTQANRVVGGRDADPNYWKWQVALVPKTRGNPFCGGSLINDRFVLSAAHCVVTTGLLALPRAGDVILNAYDLKDKTEKTIRRGIISIVPHPLYDPVSQDYDYAIIEFSEPVDLASTQEPIVTPVCLPPRQNRDSFVGEIGTVTGWGTTSEGGEPSKILKQADIPIITNEKCNDYYKGTRITITERMLCAAYPDGGIDSCQGDSGGPFVVKNNNGRFMEVGVVSFGEGCARKDKPGVYSRVTEVNDWIRQVARRGTWCSEE